VVCEGRDGRVVVLNPRFLELAGWTEPYTGQPLDDLVSAWASRANNPQVLDDYFRACRSPAPPEGPVELQPVTGQVVEARFQFLTGADGTRYRVWFFQEWRTSALAWVSHEIKNPLNAVLGFSELLAEGLDAGAPVSDSLRESLRGLRVGAKHLQSVLGDLLDLSRLEAGVVEPRPEWVQPAAFLEEISDLFRHRFLRRGLEFAVETPEGELPELWFDPIRVSQILSNLLSNALKFTKRGWVKVQLRAAGSGWEFGVEDSGLGIPHDQQKTIFEPFVQRQGQDSQRFGGTGLGLAICRTLAQSLGAQLGLESAPGRGSRFTLRFDRLESRPAQLRARPTPRPPRGGQTLLVVDDERTTHLLIQGFLRGTDLNVVSAFDGSQALELFETHRPAAVLLDMRMPGLDGSETARRLRDLPGGASTPLLAMSATRPGSHETLDQRGQNLWSDFLEKPFSKQVFLNFLLNHLSFVDESVGSP